jgi:hypothetical protein
MCLFFLASIAAGGHFWSLLFCDRSWQRRCGRTFLSPSRVPRAWVGETAASSLRFPASPLFLLLLSLVFRLVFVGFSAEPGALGLAGGSHSRYH